MSMAQTDKSVDALNSFLRGEISAVETYRQAIGHVTDERTRALLEECQRDHEHRVEAIRERIEKLGGLPAEGSGPWGVFAKVVQGGADLLGEKAAIQALEEGEDHGLADYQRDVEQVHGEARRFVRMELLPAQKRTHERLSRLKRTLH
jgi:demethoxyubiquinone hydroxylase (CLK1/Coq7/Cat5 family)